MKMETTKDTLWNMRTSKTDRTNFAKLKKQMKVRSEAEAVRRAVAMALQATDIRSDQSSQPLAIV
jgi:hypothetical protein